MANEETSETEETNESFGLKQLSVSGFSLNPEFQTDVYEYRIELNENLDKLDIEAIATQENANVEITGNENLQDGENIITILVKGDTEDQNVAYQIIVNKSVEGQDNKANQDKMKKIIIIAGVAGIILIIVVFVIIKKIRGAKDKAFVPYENLFDSTKDNEEINMFETSNNPVNPTQDNEKEIFEEEEEKPKRKKHSKGKRFK